MQTLAPMYQTMEDEITEGVVMNNSKPVIFISSSFHENRRQLTPSIKEVYRNWEIVSLVLLACD